MKTKTKTSEQRREAGARLQTRTHLSRLPLFLVLCSLLIGSCDSPTGTFEGDYEIGDIGPGGGKIFYVSSSGFTVNGKTCHYLEAAPSDAPEGLTWDSSVPYHDTGAYGTGIGQGWANTAAILAVDAAAPAALYCRALTTGGKNDWYLPSIDELKALYNNRNSIGGFNNSISYWSSTQIDDYDEYFGYYAALICDNDGDVYDQNKASNFGVRPIRAF